MIKALNILIIIAIPFVNCFAADSDAPDGEALYKKKCASCHGKTGEGANPKIAKKLLKIDPELLSLAPMAGKADEAVREVLIKGKEKMPAFGEKFSAAEIDAVFAYCRKLVPRKEAAEEDAGADKQEAAPEGS